MGGNIIEKILAAPGCSWMLLAASCCFALLLLASGCFWLLLAASGHSWLRLAAPCYSPGCYHTCVHGLMGTKSAYDTEHIAYNCIRSLCACKTWSARARQLQSWPAPKSLGMHIQVHSAKHILSPSTAGAAQKVEGTAMMQVQANRPASSPG